MCHFITVILAGTFDLAEVNEIAEPFSIHLLPFANPSVSQYLEFDEAYFSAAADGCDCGTDLCRYLDTFELMQQMEYAFQDIDQQVEKYRQKGISEETILRWQIHQSEMAVRQQVYDRPHPLPGNDCIRFSSFFDMLFEKTMIRSAGFLLHFYHGDLETEQIHLHGRRVFRRKHLLPETLFVASEDTLNIFLQQ